MSKCGRFGIESKDDKQHKQGERACGNIGIKSKDDGKHKQGE
jgi:hypothetical protein